MTSNSSLCDCKSSIQKRFSTKLTFADYSGAFLCRISNKFRMNFSVTPGLYTIGNPRSDSPVLVTANYKLSVNALRANLNKRDVWLLVVDTKGINVWCAAGKGTFCTNSILKEIIACNLSNVVSHNTLILPQLGASGVNATKLQKESGFKVKFGPIRASDIPYYLDNNFTAAKEMRRVHFSVIDRLKLVPMELIPALKSVFLFLIIAAILFGITKSGIMYKPALAGVTPLALAGFTAIITGTILTPIFLPIIPFRAFTLKGLLLGAIGAALLLYTVPLFRINLFLATLCLIVVPVLSSYFAFLFTGSTTYTSPSGVKSELKRAWPLYIASSIISTILFIIILIQFWGLI